MDPVEIRNRAHAYTKSASKTTLKIRAARNPTHARFFKQNNNKIIAQRH